MSAFDILATPIRKIKIPMITSGVLIAIIKRGRFADSDKILKDRISEPKTAIEIKKMDANVLM